MQPILSVRDLASRLGTPPARLREIGRNIKAHYTTRPLRQGSKVRQLQVPGPELKEIQRLINSNILANVQLTPGVHGGVRGRSPRKNAADHATEATLICSCTTTAERVRSWRRRLVPKDS